MRDDLGKATRLQAILDERAPPADHQTSENEGESARAQRGSPPGPPPLNPPTGNGNPDDMEPRIAVLEADMKHVKEALAKLADVPSDLATLKERTSHLATKADVKTDLDVAVDRLGSRTQRQVTIAGGLLGLLATVLAIGSKLF